MDIIFVNEPNCSLTMVSLRKKNEQCTITTWIVQRSENTSICKNERFKIFWTILIMHKWSFSEKTNEIDGNLAIILRTNKIFFKRVINRMNKRNEKSWMRPSLDFFYNETIMNSSWIGCAGCVRLQKCWSLVREM